MDWTPKTTPKNEPKLAPKPLASKKISELEINMLNIHELLGEILLSKHKDYGPYNIAHAPGGPLNGLRVRMHDKLARINHLIDTGDTPNHESLVDSFIDLANYAIIAILVQRGQWEGTTAKGTHGIKNTEKGTDPLRSSSTISRYPSSEHYPQFDKGGEAR